MYQWIPPPAGLSFDQDWLIDWMVFTLLSTIFQSYHSNSSHYSCLSWVSTVLGYGSEVSCPRTLLWKNPEDLVWLESGTPGLWVTLYHWATQDPPYLIKKYVPFPTMFATLPKIIFNFFTTLFCRLQMLSIWTSLKLCRLGKSLSFTAQSQAIGHFSKHCENRRKCWFSASPKIEFRPHFHPSQTSTGFYVSAVFLKTLIQKKKLLVTSNFCFSHSVFYYFGEFSSIFVKSEIVVCKLFQFGRV